MVELVIRCDPATGAVKISGPLEQTFLCQGMLAEARRLIEQIAAARDAQAKPNGGRSPLVLARVLPPGA